TVIKTGRGSVSATKVVVATNAYSHPTFGYLARRLVPVTAYICATQELPSDLLRELIPHNRMVADTKRALYALRLSPDRKRIIFAGRAKFGDLSEREATPILHRFICSV